MTSLPLHPAIVHVPLGLAFILPALAIGYAWTLWKGTVRPRAWLAIVALQAVLLAAGVVAMNTGEREEDRVERVVPSAALEQHEAYAEHFVWATGFTLVLAGLVLVSRRPAIAHALIAATVAGTVVVAVAAIRVGHAGGRLVYEHNAGAAYATAAAAGPGTPTAREARRNDDDDR